MTYLDHTELADITGRVRPSAQIRWLIARGLRPRRRADGAVLVKRSDYQEYLNGNKKETEPTRTPDFSGL